MDRKKKPRRKRQEHDIPIAKLPSMITNKRRIEEASEIRSPSLSHDDFCRLADGISPEKNDA
jgi:hypothetical protein